MAALYWSAKKDEEPVQEKRGLPSRSQFFLLYLWRNNKYDRMKHGLLLIFSAVVVLFAGCEQGYEYAESDGVSEEEEELAEGYVKVTFAITDFEQIPFDDAVYATRADDEADTVCTRIDLAVFEDDEKIESVNQTVDEEDFGTVSLSLPEGDYELVILAHSGTGSATITSPDVIKFRNNKLTDTFYYYGDISISGTATYEISLRRAVAMFRLVVSDDTPEDVTQMEFYYTGGSSTFDATSGYGNVSSRQTEYRDVEEDAYTGSSEYEIYTFPHEDDDALKIVVSALDDSEETLYETTFTDVPVNINVITQYTGEFFGTTTEEAGFNITVSIADEEWNLTEYTY